MCEPIYYLTFDSPVGPLTILSERGAIVGLRFATHQHEAWSPEPTWSRDADSPLLRDAAIQLGKFFAGARTTFNLPLRPAGTDFQRKVWAELARIPFGRTISYGELARRVGNANASRAVGLANGRNPIAIVIPCHRVIGADGTLTGFGGGLETKRKLLDLERVAPALLV